VTALVTAGCKILGSLERAVAVMPESRIAQKQSTLRTRTRYVPGERIYTDYPCLSWPTVIVAEVVARVNLIILRVSGGPSLAAKICGLALQPDGGDLLRGLSFVKEPGAACVIGLVSGNSRTSKCHDIYAVFS
jgi:hypothetical protein